LLLCLVASEKPNFQQATFVVLKDTAYTDVLNQIDFGETLREMLIGLSRFWCIF